MIYSFKSRMNRENAYVLRLKECFKELEIIASKSTGLRDRHLMPHPMQSRDVLKQVLRNWNLTQATEFGFWGTMNNIYNVVE